MTYRIMGTAGHIDHGKTTLIKALTDFDCDTHPEEKSRGITINLGFTHLVLPGGESIGIVDVPGHADFIDTMVAGASGIDVAMLVIAADSGVMPQTVEHLRIMETLGIQRGLIALTKIDRTDDDVLQMAESEIKELVQGTFLEGSAVVKISATTGEGLDRLKEQIEAAAMEQAEKESSELFRMYIDRIFTKKGFGTVVTGSSLGGSLKKDDHVYLLPGGKEARIRKLERHGAEVEEAAAGSRIAINLSGLNLDDYKRGMIVSSKVLPETLMADANLKLFFDVKGLDLWSQVTFLTGTYKSQVRIHLLDKDRIKAGDQAVVQIHFQEPCILVRGDKFIIRDSSETVTFGGGEILDAFPLHHKRRPEKLLNYLKDLSIGDLLSFIKAEVKKTKNPVSLNHISSLTGLSPNDIKKFISSNIPSGISEISAGRDTYLIRQDEKEKIQKKVLKSITNYHKRNPLNEMGRSLNELLGIVKIEWNNVDKDLLHQILIEMENDKSIKNVNDTWTAFNHEVELTNEIKSYIDFIEKFIEKADKHTPLSSELEEAADKKKIPADIRDQILFLLVSQNKIYNIDGSFLHHHIVDSGREQLIEYLSEKDEGITVAQFRDLIDANRKLCLLLFSQYEKEGIMLRAGDLRVLTEKGIKMAEAK